jgi:HNH endonuclease
MPECIYSRTIFEQATEEHVLQNFLGARWDTPLIACNECQQYFSQSIDKAFEIGLLQIRNLFGTKGGRRGEGPTLERLTTSADELIDLEPGATPRLRQPEVQVTPRSDGRHDVRIKLGHRGQLGWALKMLREQLPDKTINEATIWTMMQATQSFLAGSVQHNVNVGGLDFFRGLVKAAFNMLAAHAGDGPAIALDPAFDAVRAFVRHGHGEMPEFVRWMTQNDIPQAPRRGPIDQAIGLISRGTSVEGVVQVFGHLQFPFRLTNSYAGRPISCGYVVDPLREADSAEQRLTEYPAEGVPDFASQSPYNNAAVQNLFLDKYQRVLATFYSRAEQTIIRDSFTEIMGPADGQPLTEELVNRLAASLAQKIEPLLRVPSLPVGQ